MPWSDITPMSQRIEFVELYHQRRHTVAELCRLFCISEKTAYKVLARFRAEGFAGLADRSHTPKCAPHQLSPEVIERVLSLRGKHPTWGARKLRSRLMVLDPLKHWPAPSTIGSLLTRHGLTRPRRRSFDHRGPRLDQSLASAHAPNDVWTADFKGEFALISGRECYPLTIADLHSRFLLGCTALSGPRCSATQLVFRRIFQCYGLPRVIRTDNGPPFASARALAALSPLALWWIHLGIRPERIRPGHPQQNGQHERMHRTLKAEAIRPAPARTLVDQQRRFDHFRREFNTERPHEALGQTTPQNHYVTSTREYPVSLPRFEYDAGALVRRVSCGGFIKWCDKPIFLSSVLAGEDVSLEETASDQWTIAIGPLALGVLNQADQSFTPGAYWLEKTPEPADDLTHPPGPTSPIIPV